MNRAKTKNENIIQAVIAIAIILLLNFISANVFTRIDLTTDKRYTISENTKELLNSIDEVLFFRIYLDGDLPAGFKRLQSATVELLNEFRAYAGDNIQYEIINPSESESKNTRNKIYQQLYNKGLNPTNLNIKDNDGSTSQKIIFPGILVSYNGNEFPVNILKNNVAFSPDANLHSSIQALEYELSFAVKQLTTDRLPLIGFVEGHGELDPIHLNDMASTLSQFYGLVRVKINGDATSLTDSLGNNIFDLLVIAKPENEFSEQDKYIIDQHIMRGGNTLWLIDNVKIDIDSLTRTSTTIALPHNLNLDDQLFTYGVRINPNLMQDMQCAVIPVNTAINGQKPKFVPAPWVYYPLLIPSTDHPVSKNVDLVKTQFISQIDTVGLDPKIKKSVILKTSNYSRTAVTPALIDLSMVSEKIEPSIFSKPEMIAGILLEGNFKSVYTNRITPSTKGKFKPVFIEQSNEAKMIVISDGDIIKNEVRGVGENIQPLALGYDRFTKQTFGNKEFLLNCINYLCNNEDIIETRSKEYKLRMLNKAEITEYKTKWQFINVALPIIITIIAGLAYSRYRKNKYTR